MDSPPTKLKKTYSSVLRQATKRAQGMLDTGEEGDTDSMASDTSSVRRPTKHVSPLLRRRSTRLLDQRAGLQSQNTVMMSEAAALPRHPQRMETSSASNRWGKHRRTASAMLRQQDTLLVPGDVGPLPPSAAKRRRRQPEDNMLKKQSTTASLRGLMHGTRLDSAQAVDPVPPASAAVAVEAVATVSVRRKRSARAGILKPRTKVSIATSARPPPRSSIKHALSEDEDGQTTLPSAKRRRPLVTRKSTVAAQEGGSVYIPAREEWPVAMDGQVVWSVPLLRPDGSRRHALAVHVEPTRCLLGDEDGTVIALDAEVRPSCEYHLPAGVKCLLPDGQHVYAACNDGALYDISNEEPRLIWKAKGFGQLYQLDTYEGQVAVSDEHGNVGLVSYDGAFLWKQRSGGAFGWMVCIDDSGVYHGHAGGLTKYSRLDGQQMWHCPTPSPVMAGCKVEDYLYAAVGTAVFRVDKYSGEIVQRYDQGKSSSGVLHCCAVGGGLVYAGGNKLVCYDAATGSVVYVMRLSQRAESLHYFHARLFCLGAGALHVLDLTQPSITLAKLGKSVVTVEVNPNPSTPQYSPRQDVRTVTQQQSEQEQASGAVLLECYKEKPKERRGKLRVRALSKGYSGQLAIQFPVDLCKPGAKYVVQKLELSEGSSFYRVSGKIQFVEAEKK